MVFLALSTRSLLGPRRGPRSAGVPARLAGLTALAIEMSGLTDEKSDPALTRGITKLRAAGDALAENLPDGHVRTLLDNAEAELDDTAWTLGRNDYRPYNYLRGRLA